jgi:trafficking protein particle complex subunit 11
VAAVTPASLGLAEHDALRVLGLNPANALQHPGFYYYMAAQATERRHARFLALLETPEVNNANLPGFANEKRVDHSGIVLEVRYLGYIYMVLSVERNVALHQSVRTIQEALAVVQWTRPR